VGAQIGGFDPLDSSTDPSTPAGIGNLTAAAVLSFRHHDGANQLGDLASGAYSDYTGYQPVNDAYTIHASLDAFFPGANSVSHAFPLEFATYCAGNNCEIGQVTLSAVRRRGFRSRRPTRVADYRVGKSPYRAGARGMSEQKFRDRLPSCLG
jgi:hypothetical protein